MVSIGGLKGNRKELDRRIREQKEAAERIRKQVEDERNKQNGGEGLNGFP